MAGVVFPRQELAFGSKTWLVHGVLWTAFHLFKWWRVLPLLASALLLSLMVTRRRSSSPALLAHTLEKVPGLLGVILWVVG